MDGESYRLNQSRELLANPSNWQMNNWPARQFALERSYYSTAARSELHALKWPACIPPQWQAFTPPLTLDQSLALAVATFT
mmetsp:Transcript_27255/g.49933  ORF Transcript_27255/g.49933 Transcript_27255/m.49933 type:complete len:81 (+) Transcript_27255:223-465(+)